MARRKRSRGAGAAVPECERVVGGRDRTHRPHQSWEGHGSRPPACDAPPSTPSSRCTRPRKISVAADFPQPGKWREIGVVVRGRSAPEDESTRATDESVRSPDWPDRSRHSCPSAERGATFRVSVAEVKADLDALWYSIDHARHRRHHLLHASACSRARAHRDRSVSATRSIPRSRSRPRCPIEWRDRGAESPRDLVQLPLHGLLVDRQHLVVMPRMQERERPRRSASAGSPGIGCWAHTAGVAVATERRVR